MCVFEDVFMCKWEFTHVCVYYVHACACVSDVLWVYIVFIVYRHPRKGRKIANFAA